MNGIILVFLILTVIGIAASIFVLIKKRGYCGWDDYDIMIPFVLTAMQLICLMVFVGSRIADKTYCRQLKEEKEQIEKIISVVDDENYYNAGIYQKVIDYNSKVTRIKTLQSRYGYFSGYYGYKVEYIDLEEK